MIALVLIALGITTLIYGAYRGFRNWDDWAWSLTLWPLGIGFILAGVIVAVITWLQ